MHAIFQATSSTGVGGGGGGVLKGRRHAKMKFGTSQNEIFTSSLTLFACSGGIK